MQNAADAGAKAVIIYNDKPGLQYDITLMNPGNWLPAVFISQDDGRHLISTAGSIATVVNAESSYRYLNGTSMAAPHVSGAIAVLAAAYPQETVSQRIDRIFQGVDSLETLADSVATGGRLNLNNSLRLYRARVGNMAPIFNLLLLDSEKQ